MTVWGFKEDQSLIFSKTIDDLKIVNNNTLIFIQTDKYMYIPGQTGNINLFGKFIKGESNEERKTIPNFCFDGSEFPTPCTKLG